MSIDTLLQKLQGLRNDAQGPGPSPAATQQRTATPAATPAAPPKSSMSAAKSMPAPVSRNVAEAAPAPGTQDLKDFWAKFVDAVGKASPFARTYLLEAHPVSLARNVLTIGFDPAFADHLGLVDNPKNRALLLGKLQEFGLADPQVKFIQARAPEDWVPLQLPTPTVTPESPAASAPSGPAMELKQAKAAPLSKEDFKNDPLIRQALEIFKGQIVEVRV